MRLLVGILLAMASTTVAAQRLPTPARLNLAGIYQAQRQPQIDARREGDSLRIFVRFPEANAPRASEPLRVFAWESPEARQPSWQARIRPLDSPGGSKPQERWAEFCVPLAPLSSARLLAVWPEQAVPDNPSAAAWLTLTEEIRKRPFVLTDTTGRPLLRRYLQAGETVELDCFGQERAATLRRFEAEFTAALPPHTDPAMQPQGRRTLPAETTQELRPGQRVRILEPGLYTLKVGEGAPLGLLVQPSTFPELTTAPELIDPLRYLITAAEREQLLQAQVPKRAVDQFWLRAAANQQPVARQLIRTFYGRVADANRLFTAHKPGWMTDRGLLYVVLGPPDRVLRSSTEERWEYLDDVQGGPYVFRPKPSTFATDYYELVRRPEHEWLWYRAVAQWRKGLTVPQGAAR